MKKISLHRLEEMKAQKEPISMLTAYSFWQARLVEEAGADMILVGDSLGMVEQGFSGTLPVTLEMMILASQGVTRGASKPFIVGDMPFLSYETGESEAIRNAGRLVKEAGVDAVKLEGGTRQANTVRALTRAGIAVVGHIGLTPQSATLLGGFKVQGKDPSKARELVEDARALEEAGARLLILECIPAPLAERITADLSIPTIGIGAGGGCDGQVLVLHDVLGLYGDFQPRFVKRYIQGGALLRDALKEHVEEVRRKEFPRESHCFGMDREVLKEVEDS
jgi:3-methyl-2-oxobutanoate hydroxymethyltransferase